MTPQQLAKLLYAVYVASAAACPNGQPGADGLPRNTPTPLTCAPEYAQVSGTGAKPTQPTQQEISK